MKYSVGEEALRITRTEKVRDDDEVLTLFTGQVNILATGKNRSINLGIVKENKKKKKVEELTDRLEI